MLEKIKGYFLKTVDLVSWAALGVALLDAVMKWIVDYDIFVAPWLLAIVGVLIRILRAIPGGKKGLLPAVIAAVAGVAGVAVEPEYRQPCPEEAVVEPAEECVSEEFPDILLVTDITEL